MTQTPTIQKTANQGTNAAKVGLGERKIALSVNSCQAGSIRGPDPKPGLAFGSLSNKVKLNPPTTISIAKHAAK